MSDCITRVSKGQAIQAQIDAQAAARFSARYLNLEMLFCYEGYCPAIVNGKPVRYAGSHMTPSYGKAIAPSLYAALLR